MGAATFVCPVHLPRRPTMSLTVPWSHSTGAGRGPGGALGAAAAGAWGGPAGAGRRVRWVHGRRPGGPVPAGRHARPHLRCGAHHLPPHLPVAALLLTCSMHMGICIEGFHARRQQSQMEPACIRHPSPVRLSHRTRHIVTEQSRMALRSYTQHHALPASGCRHQTRRGARRL